ncbi:MAG: bifunctional diaminohydroxyphosphoribosylaminopyrimidine deaminase/5-amino-6-(5-phosphoribosylamino)uracil reductase RibD [Hyphomicrobiaceae bacterium]|nr:bifunctional diaminohydroxyphosphoribosylaminopyrimidine deaminase/5-amino-6-(5-phosphoribosylamino)uracil reductase RibD [Hyphomicrobiaceae bacterium]
MPPKPPTAGDQHRIDHHMMGIALRMARRGLGQTAPNPTVGAVIVEPQTGEVIARGWTQTGGRPHAEPVALAQAGARARGATMYVTLEPCSHHGKTPPCSDAVLAAGIARLVVALQDPDPRVSGRGLEQIRRAGVAVTRGVRAEEAHWLTRGHIVRVTERRPFVQLKIAVGADGRVPRGAGGEPVFVTGAEARARGHLMRAEADAILVGHGTVRDDDPDLTCRLPGLAHRSPRRVVLAADVAGLAESRLARSARMVPVQLFTASGAQTQTLGTLGVEVSPTRLVAGRLWLPDVLEALAQSGITRLLVEGGPGVWASFVRHGLFDEVVLFHARGGGQPVAEEAARAVLQAVAGIAGLDLSEHRRLGGDDMLVFRQRSGRVSV